MITFDVEQNSPEWLQARLGVATASEFDKIITPGGKLSTSAEGYMNKLLAEIMTGEATMFQKSEWMERGNELEQEAAEYYELQNDCDLVKIGFCTNDSQTFGCSPDRLVGEEGLLEIKVPAPHTHMSYLLKGEIDKGYWPQIQGQLLVTGRKWVDWMSYNPKMPAVIIRVERDIPYLALMQKALDDFGLKFEAAKEVLGRKGYL